MILIEPYSKFKLSEGYFNDIFSDHDHLNELNVRI